MKAEVIGLLSSTGAPEIKISHNGEELIFSASCYGRNSFHEEYDVFDHINRYWETFPEDKATALFNCYREISILFSTIWARAALTSELNKKVIELMSFHKFEDLHQWVLFSPFISIPPAFETEYVHNIDRQGSREQTYIRSDYTKLIALAMAMRTMIPIWGHYIAFTRQETGTLYKEYYAFQLLHHSEIIHSEPFKKLLVYIDRTVGEDRCNPTTITEGISSEDYTTWMLALVVVRRLAVGDIRGSDPRANMVTFIHRYVTSKMKGSDIAADSAVKPKIYDEGGSDIESKLSALERFKIKHDLSLGEIVELLFSVSDLRKTAFRLSANMTDELLQRSLKSVEQLYTQRLLDPQVMLLRWIMKPVISPRGLMYLDQATVVNTFGVLQAVLWARGHHYLALLSTSYANFGENEMFLTSSDSRQRIPKDMVAELDRIYPFHKIVGGRKSSQRPINLAVKSIETLADNLSMFTWTMTADSELITQAFGHCNTKRIPIPSDIKIKLARLVIELGNRNWT